MVNKKTSDKKQNNGLKAVNKNETKHATNARPFPENYDNDIHTDPLGSWTGVPLDDPYDKPIQDADDL